MKQTAEQVLTYLKPKDQVTQVVQAQHDAHKPVDLQRRRLFKGGTTSSRVTNAEYNMRVFRNGPMK